MKRIRIVPITQTSLSHTSCFAFETRGACYARECLSCHMSYLWFQAMEPQHICLHAFAPAHPGQVHLPKILFLGCSYDPQHCQLTTAYRKLIVLPLTGCAPFPPLASHGTCPPTLALLPEYTSQLPPLTLNSLSLLSSVCANIGDSEIPLNPTQLHLLPKTFFAT